MIILEEFLLNIKKSSINEHIVDKIENLALKTNINF